jgi:glycine reductase
LNCCDLQNKKFVILGDRDAIPSFIIAGLLEDSGLEVAYRSVQCPLCCYQGTVDPEEQGAIASLAEKHGAGNLIVVSGQRDEDHIRMSAQTLTKGDPTGVGPLYGVELGLTIYHVLEPGFRDLFKPELYDRHLGFYSKFYDCRKIEDLMGELLGPRLSQGA